MEKTPAEIEAWLIERLARGLGIDPQRLDKDKAITRYGLDSIVAAELTVELEDWLKRPIPERLLWDEPTINFLVDYLSGDRAEAAEKLFPGPHPLRSAGEGEASTALNASGAHRSAPRARAEQGSEPVAIIGMSCRLPGANCPDAFWRLLRNRLDAIGEVPEDRWNAQNLYDPDPSVAGKMTSRWGGFLTDIDLFDPHFFGISPREAAHMDPQQRLLLEVAWEALENAGLVPGKLAGSEMGIFIGMSTNDYFKGYYAHPELIDAYTNTGNAHSIAAGRLAYLLDVHGPSVAVDTACSSSLVALHLACQSLLTGESTLVLAGGVNIILAPEATMSFSKARMISPDGHCKSFSVDASGLVRGEGCSLVVLKRLSDALADGNRILALIRGSAVNQDGRSNGLTAPNGLAQQAVTRRALARAGIAPDRLAYVVGQGTGTPLGDKVELQALEAVLAEPGARTSQCAISSVKANIGHLEAAAGVTNVIAAILAMQHEEIPPQLHFQPGISPEPLNGRSLFIPAEVQSWPKGAQPRFAGVSAFSISGTNGYLVLEEAPPVSSIPPIGEDSSHLLTLSAQSETALKDLAGRYERYLSSASLPTLADICFTARVGRTVFPHRLAVTGETHSQIASALHTFCAGETEVHVRSGYAQEEKPPKVAFLFSAEAGAYSSPGAHLYETQPIFRATIDACSDLLEADLEHPLSSVLYPPAGNAELLASGPYAQPALFALEYALATLWQSWGVMPDAVMGDGVGAYVAACLAGAISLEDALWLVLERSRTVQPQAFARVASLIPYEKLTLPFISLLSGECLLPGEQITAEYWCRQMCEPARSGEGITTLARQGFRLFIEAGPSCTLSEMGKQLLPGEQYTWLSCFSPGQDNESESLLLAAGTLFVRGRLNDLSQVAGPGDRRLVSLPTYPFQRERCWIFPAARRPIPREMAGNGSHPLLGQRVRSEV